jgi:hypothetical protein
MAIATKTPAAENSDFAEDRPRETVHVTTDKFDARLDVLQAGHAPQREIDAAIAVHERLRPAPSIRQALVARSHADRRLVRGAAARCDQAARRRTPIAATAQATNTAAARKS